MHTDTTLFDLALVTAYRDALAMETPARIYPQPDPTPEGDKPARRGRRPRVYASQYIGVALIKGRYVGDTARRRNERDAACDRAARLGVDFLERRDGTRESL